MATRLRIGIAGLGRIGWLYHAAALRESADFAITAVSDPVAERRAEAEQTTGCRAFSDYATMLAEAPLDAVVIATPTHLHKEQALAAFRRGLHVLLEKPMAVDAKEAEAIVRTAERRQRLLTVYQPRRLAASFQHLRQIVASGRLGRLCRAQIGMFSFSRRNDWQAFRKYGGGMLNNYGAHGLDQLLQLIGYDVRRCFCALQCVQTLGDADDAVKIVIQTRSGALGELDISQASGLSPYGINLWGTCGALSMDQGRIRMRWFDPAALPAKAIHRQLASPDRRYPSDDLPWQTAEIPVDPSLEISPHANFAAAIRGEATLAVPPRETLRLMRLLDRLRADAGAIADLRTHKEKSHEPTA